MLIDEALEIVSFAAGGHRFAVEARQIDRMLDLAPESAVRVEALLGLIAVADAAPRRWLSIGAHCVEVGAPVELRAVPAGLIHPLPALVAARIQLQGIRALALEAGNSMLLVDLRDVLAQQAG